MFDRWFLQKMYQQWQQGIDVHTADNIRFVELVMKQTNATREDVLLELSKCRWFGGIGETPKD